MTRFELLDELTNELRIRQLLWESLKQWDQSLLAWMSSDFTSLDPEEIMHFTNMNLKNVQQMEKLLTENLIVPQFKDKVQSMKEKVIETSRVAICAVIYFELCFLMSIQ